MKFDVCKLKPTEALCSEQANITLVVHVDITYLYIPLSYNVSVLKPKA
jgi:hypothetical protein